MGRSSDRAKSIAGRLAASSAESARNFRREATFGRFNTLGLACVEAWWHFEKRSHHVPELLAVGPKSDRMGSTWKHHELPILDRKLPEEVQQVVLARNAVILPAG